MKRRSTNQDVDPLRLGIVVTAMTLIEFTAVVYFTTVIVSWAIG